MKIKTRHVLLALMLASPAVFLVGCSRAHIKVVDQYGKPIEGVLIRQSLYHPSWIPLTFPGNTGSTEIITQHTNARGRVVLPEDSSGFPVNITHVEKAGYQFRAREQIKRDYWGRRDSGLRPDEYKFTYKNPLIIRGWKREEQPELTYVSAGVRIQRIPNTTQTCTLNSGEKDHRIDRRGFVHPYQPADLPLIMRVQMGTAPVPPRTWDPAQKYELTKWYLELEILGAQVRETNDLFMNLADESGYQEAVIFEGIQDRNVKIFIKADDGAFYGGGILRIGPVGSSRAPDQHHIDFNLWLNLNGSRNIMRPPDRISWGAGGGYNLKCQELEGRQ